MASAPGKGRRQGRGRCGGACSGEERAGAEPWSWPQNIHLVARWLSTLDKKLERHSTGSHDDYRVFISAEPAPSPESHIIPQGILENAIKITNEPPTGMYANLHKALDLFTQVGPLPWDPSHAFHQHFSPLGPLDRCLPLIWLSGPRPAAPTEHLASRWCSQA